MISNSEDSHWIKQGQEAWIFNNNYLPGKKIYLNAVIKNVTT